jgi:hypothetical protein
MKFMTGEQHMRIKRQILCPVVILILIFGVWCRTSGARTYRAQIYANSDDFMAKVESESLISDAVLKVGAGFAFSEGDYQMGNVFFAVQDEVFIPALTLGLGFKGVMGTADVDDDDYNIAAIGFMALGEYDFRKIYYNLPVLIYANFTGSPDPLSFDDTDTYLELDMGVKGYIVRNAAVVLGFRSIEVRFDEDSDKIKLNDDAFYFGVEISF